MEYKRTIENLKISALGEFFYLLLSLLAGALLPFAFAPFEFYALAVLSPAILLWVWLNSTARQSFWRGFIFGLAFFGVGASWVFVSIHEFGNTNILLAGFLTALFIGTLALFPACQGYLFKRIFPENTFYKITLAFPAAWVLFEWIRSWFLTGFPWLFLGASQTNSVLRGFAPLVGEYGLSLLVTFLSALLVLSFISLKKSKPIQSFFSVLIILSLFSGGYFLSSIAWTKSVEQPISVSLIQGNIPQQMKWDQAYLDMTLQRYFDLTADHWNSKIIIWPEAAIPLFLDQAKPFLSQMETLAKQNHTTLITGIPIKQSFDYYNGVIALGDGHGTYYKRHLVPFGEYVPLDSLLRGLIGFFDIPMSNFSAGPKQQDNLHIDGLAIAPFICYEIAYPELVLKSLPQANLLLTVSNDAWFGHSFAAAQHLQIAQLRALETGRYLLFSNNTGVSAIINPQGKITKASEAFVTTSLQGQVEKMTGTTPLVLIGHTVVLLFIFGLLIFSLWTEWRKHSSRKVLMMGLQ